MAGGTLPGKSRCRSLPSSVRREDKGAAHVGLVKTARSIYPLEGRRVARPGFISSSRAEAEDHDSALPSSFPMGWTAIGLSGAVLPRLGKGDVSCLYMFEIQAGLACRVSRGHRSAESGGGRAA